MKTVKRSATLREEGRRTERQSERLNKKRPEQLHESVHFQRRIWKWGGKQYRSRAISLRSSAAGKGGRRMAKFLTGAKRKRSAKPASGLLKRRNGPREENPDPKKSWEPAISSVLCELLTLCSETSYRKGADGVKLGTRASGC